MPELHPAIDGARLKLLTVAGTPAAMLLLCACRYNAHCLLSMHNSLADMRFANNLFKAIKKFANVKNSVIFEHKLIFVRQKK